MQNSLFIKFFSQVGIPGPTPGQSLFNLDLPFITGVFERGALSAVSFFISMFFSLIIVVWVFYTLFAVIKIISKGENPEELEKGFNSIKNIWIGITMGLGFFVVVALAGNIAGFGSVYDWSTKLAQCGGYQGQFYFRQVPSELEAYQKNSVTYTGGNVWCCKVTAQPVVGSYVYYKGWQVGQWNYVVSSDGFDPPGGSFSECKMQFSRILD